MTEPVQPSAFSIAVHESAHAVAGICLGLKGRLEWVSIIENEQRKGGCKWNLDGHVAILGEDYAGRFAGPLGEVIQLPERFGDDIEEFRKTINQPRERLLKWGLGGWLTSDLVPFKYVIPYLQYQEGDAPEKLSLRGIERRMRELLSRASTRAAIDGLARQLEREREIAGAVAERLIVEKLTPSDFVPRDFLVEKSPPAKSIAG